MKTVIFFIIAILLAIPTYGISIIVFIFAKYKQDSYIAKRFLIKAIITSYEKGGSNQILYSVNNEAIRLTFDILNGRILNENIGNLPTGAGSYFSGILQHPLKPIMLLVTMSQISNNRLVVKATEIDLDNI